LRLRWLWRLKPRRCEPLAHVRADLGLAGFAQEVLSLRTMGEGFGPFAETFRFFGKSLLKRDGLRETTALPHDTTSSWSLRVLTAGFEFLRA
jgi:hypothetical protein